MPGFFCDTIVVRRAITAQNAYGDARPDWSAASATTVTDVAVQPLSQVESEQADRDVATTRWRLLTPRGVDLDLLVTDRVEWSGLTLMVDGKVGRWPLRGGGVHHVEAVLKEVAG